MEIREAQRIVNTLAQGIDPNTGEVFDGDSPYNEPTIIRALYTVHEFVNRAPKPAMTLAERRQRNLDIGRPANCGLPWTEEARSTVAEAFAGGRSVEQIAVDLERTRGGIRAELIRQELVPPDFE
jgi:hypothetical protein